MNVTGRAMLTAPPEAVFGAICDPGALLEAIPGCEDLRRISGDEYRGRIVLRLPGIAGTYETEVRLAASDPPRSGSLEGRVAGRAGSIAGSATFRLAPAGPGTLVEYEATGIVSGPLARLDSRFVEGLAGTLVGEGLARLDRGLAAGREPVMARADR